MIYTFLILLNIMLNTLKFIFAALTNKKLLLPLYCRLNTNFFPNCIKVVVYFTSAVSVVSSNPCVGSSPRIKINYYQYS